MEGFVVDCGCGHRLGCFAAGDDHGHVIVNCGSCGKNCMISNGQLTDAADNGVVMIIAPDAGY